MQCGRRQAARPFVRFRWENFIEATEALSSKDYVFRIRISRKEAKESRYWLRLLHLETEEQENRRVALIKEAQELVLILNSIVARSQDNRKPS